MPALTDIRVPPRTRSVECRELGKIVAIKIVWFDEDRLGAQIKQVAMEIFELVTIAQQRKWTAVEIAYLEGFGVVHPSHKKAAGN